MDAGGNYVDQQYLIARRSRQPKQTITNQTGKLTQKDSLNIEIANKIPSQQSRYVDYL